MLDELARHYQQITWILLDQIEDLKSENVKLRAAYEQVVRERAEEVLADKGKP